MVSPLTAFLGQSNNGYRIVLEAQRGAFRDRKYCGATTRAPSMVVSHGWDCYI